MLYRNSEIVIRIETDSFCIPIVEPRTTSKKKKKIKKNDNSISSVMTRVFTGWRRK